MPASREYGGDSIKAYLFAMLQQTISSSRQAIPSTSGQDASFAADAHQQWLLGGAPVNTMSSTHAPVHAGSESGGGCLVPGRGPSCIANLEPLLLARIEAFLFGKLSSMRGISCRIFDKVTAFNV